ncbi:MAG: SurA N-terminal domain-containing protein [Bacteroidales bacterium]
MAVLEKIRVKMGAFITVLIAVALLSFIIDPDTLQSAMSMFSSKYDVGTINGDRVSYQNYQKKVDYFTQIYQMTAGSSANDEKTQEMINNTAWQDEITEKIIIPAANNAGVRLGNDELLDLSQGKNISPVLANEASFKNAQGAFDRTKLVQFVQAIQQDETGNLKTYWKYLEDNMVKDQMFTKYLSLLEKSNVMSPVELTRAIANNNNTYNVNFVVKPFGFSADTTIALSGQDIKAYYDKNKNNFKQQSSKDLDYVVFDVLPSTEDINLAEKDIEKFFGEFQTVANMKAFLARNSDKPFNPYFYKEGDLSSISAELEDFAKNAKVGDVLNPFKMDNTFLAARLMDIKQMPDSVFVKHILLQGDDEKKADSLLHVAQSGADFIQLAQTYSADKNPNVAEVGDIGWMTQQYIIPGMEEVFSASKGSIIKIKTSYGMHIVKIKDVTKPIRKVQVALLAKDAVASKQTYADYYAKANDFVTKCGSDLSKFASSAKELNLGVYPALRVAPSAKTLANYQNTKEITRWVNENKKGAVSPIITVDNKYFFVVAVTGVHEEGYASLDEMAPQIKNILMMEKKGEKVAADTKALVAGATTLEQIAEKLGTTVSSQTGIAFSSLTSQQLDPKFIGAIAGSKEGTLVGPIVGEIGVYYFTITGKETGAFYTEDDAKQRKNQEFMYITRVLPAIMSESANVKDERYKFY